MSHFYPTLKPPQDANTHRPPGAPLWPPMFLHQSGKISVALKHPTPFNKSLGTGIGCVVMAVLPLLLPLIFFAANTEEAGKSVCFLYFIVILIGAFSFNAIGAFIGSRLSGTTRVIFTRKAITIDPGKRKAISRKRASNIAISFRAVQLPDLEHRIIGKPPNLRADLSYRRQVEMIYGSEIILITTMINKTAAEQFVAALNAARDESAQPFKNPTGSQPKPEGTAPDERDLAQ